MRSERPTADDVTVQASRREFKAQRSRSRRLSPEDQVSVRSIARCLTILHALNAQNGATVLALSQALGLSRATVYRMLNTLELEGYVRREAQTGWYWVEAKARELGSGFADQAWILDFGKSLIGDLAAEVKASLSIATRDELHIYVRATAGGVAPAAKWRLPLGRCAAGHVHLAYCPAATREALLDASYDASHSESSSFRRNRQAMDRAEAEATLAAIRLRGFVLDYGAAKTGSLSVPVIDRGQAVAALTLERALPQGRLEELLLHLPRMMEVAEILTRARLNPPDQVSVAPPA